MKLEMPFAECHVAVRDEAHWASEKIYYLFFGEIF